MAKAGFANFRSAGQCADTLEKLSDADDYDAIMLAEAGLERLGYLPNSDERLFFDVLDEQVFYPAAGQGAIGLEIRSDDVWMNEVVERIGHGDTFLRVSAEREFLRLLDAGCHTPVGVFSELENDDLIMSARVFPESGASHGWRTCVDREWLRSKWRNNCLKHWYE